MTHSTQVAVDTDDGEQIELTHAFAAMVPISHAIANFVASVFRRTQQL
jgi:hypothetical protein